MEMLLNKEEYRSLKKSFEAAVEESAEAELSLPEYMPEILRIVKSFASVSINGVRCVGERLTVDGVCELRMVYTAEDGGVYAYSQQCAFSRYCENPLLSTAEDFEVHPSVNYVNCRAVNPKRAELKASIRLRICAFASKSENIISFENNGIVEASTVPVSAVSLGCRKSKTFSMSEALPVESGSASFIVSVFSCALPIETKKIGNKLMLRGDAVVEIAFVPTENKKTVEHIRHTLPINQILEFDGLEERFTGDVAITVSSCDVSVKTDSDGDGRAFDIALSLNASVTMWEQKDFFAVNDAYSVLGEATLSKETLDFFCSPDEVRDTYILKSTVDASKIGVTAVLDAVAECGEPTCACENGELVISGTVKASFLVRDSSDELASFEKMLDYKYVRRLTGEYNNPRFFANVTMCSFDCTAKNSSELEALAELKINCTLFDEISIDAVSDITVSDEKTVPTKSAVTVYYPQSEESLWEIAKKYNTTVSLICEENDLDGETTAQRRLIFIPSVK